MVLNRIRQIPSASQEVFDAATDAMIGGMAGRVLIERMRALERELDEARKTIERFQKGQRE